MKPKRLERSDFTRAFAQEQIELYGGIMAASRALAPNCKPVKGGDVALPPTVQKWLAAALMPTRDEQRGLAMAETIDPEITNRIAKLIIESGVPIESLGSIDHVKFKSWGVSAKQKNPDGTTEIVTKDLHSTGMVLLPKEKYEPKWPLVQPAAPTIVVYRDRIAMPWSVRTGVVLPDTQIGFLRDFQTEVFHDDGTITGKHHTIHDPDAMDIGLQIIADLQPEFVGYVGDFFDLNEMSRWLQHEEFWRTTQPALDHGERFIADVEAAAGSPAHREPTFWIDGNHDRRFQEYLLKNARAAFGLRPANTTPDTWPSHSLPGMLHFEKYGIEVCGQYPHSEKWIVLGDHPLGVRHDPSQRGAYAGSMLVGHTHGLRRNYYRRRGPHGMQTYADIEIGCMCRVDDHRFGNRSIMPTPVPSDRPHIGNWIQSLAVVTDDAGRWDVETPVIINGRCTFRGRVYTAHGKAE